MRAQSYLSSPGATWAWASTHDVEKVISVNLLKFLYLCSTNNLGSDSTVLASLLKPKLIKKEHHERHAARDPRHFFLWMFFLHTLRWLRQSLCHNENWNKTCARSGVTFTWSRHTTLWIGCVAWPDQRRRGCDTLRAVPPFRQSAARAKKKKEQKNKIKQGKKKERNCCQRATGSSGSEAPHHQFFSPTFFFLDFFFLHKRRTSLKRKTGTACSLQLPKRLQTHTKFAYCNLSRKLRC